MTEDSKPAMPIDALLADYACGRLASSLHALVASHLVLKPESRVFVSHLEALHGAEIACQECGGVARRDDRIAAIVEGRAVPITAAPQDGASDGRLPEPLRMLIGRDLDQIRWRRKLPGLREYRCASDDGLEASLLWIGAGRKMLSHTHGGSEITLVLRGAFDDERGHYGVGDIAIADAGVDHAPRASLDEDCLCFAVTDAPLHLTGRLGRFIDRVFGH